MLQKHFIQTFKWPVSQFTWSYKSTGGESTLVLDGALQVMVWTQCHSQTVYHFLHHHCIDKAYCVTQYLRWRLSGGHFVLIVWSHVGQATWARVGSLGRLQGAILVHTPRRGKFETGKKKVFDTLLNVNMKDLGGNRYPWFFPLPLIQKHSVWSTLFRGCVVAPHEKTIDMVNEVLRRWVDTAAGQESL